MKQYTAIIEKCPNTGFYIGYIPGLPGVHSQAESLDQLHDNLQEVLKMIVADGASKKSRRRLSALKH
jgi:predicted RNase H-like HicB family nuclease